MLHGWQPIVVANRAPVDSQIGPSGQERIVRGAGGLVTAMSALAQASDATWVAVAGSESDLRLSSRAGEDGVVEVVSEDARKFRVAYVQPDSTAYDLYYNQISNPLLWFIQHYLWDLGREPILDSRTERAWREGYVQVNSEFADRVVALAVNAKARPLILVQDYHLYLLPGMVRARLPQAYVRSTGRCCLGTCVTES